MTDAQPKLPARVEVPGWIVGSFIERVSSWDVHLGHQVQTSRPGELRLSTQIVVDEEDQNRYHATAARLRVISAHPAIVPIYSVGLSEFGRPYLVLEPRPGELLTDRLGRDGPMSLPDVLDRGFELADALVAAHAEGIVHGSVTPGSVWIGRDGSALLAGFDPVRSAGLALGGPAAQGSPTAGTDVRDLAVTLYAALTGEPIPSGADLILTAPTSRTAPPGSESLMPVIRRAVAVDPAKRYPDAAELRDAIAAVRAGRPAPAFGAPGSRSAPADPDDEGSSGSGNTSGGTTAVARSSAVGSDRWSRTRMPSTTAVLLVVLAAIIVTVIVLLLQ